MNELNDQLLFEYKYANRCQQGSQRYPKGGGTNIVSVDSGLTCPHGIRLHINHVILLEVIGGRRIHLAGGAKVYAAILIASNKVI